MAPVLHVAVILGLGTGLLSGAARAQNVVRVDVEVLPEGSGLVASRQHDGVLWTHNDSGDAPRFFALDRQGVVLSEWRLEGARNQDWEAIAVDDEGHLFVGDIGNNANARRDLAIYVVREPNPFASGSGLSVRPLRRLRFRYPDLPYPPPAHRRNYDAESLFWSDGSLFLLSKHRSDTRTRLWRLPSLDTESEQVLVAQGEAFETGETGLRAGGQVTGADITPDGRLLAVLTYHQLLVFENPATEQLGSLRSRTRLTPLTSMQCEAIAWDGTDLVFSNEQGFVHRLPDARAGLPPRYPPRP